MPVISAAGVAAQIFSLRCVEAHRVPLLSRTEQPRRRQKSDCFQNIGLSLRIFATEHIDARRQRQLCGFIPQNRAA